ncbi:MAG: hypothetical protein OXE85_00875 [Roseovarius sp.]|nr:hypothetical protein [Roseovarius sp.]
MLEIPKKFTKRFNGIRGFLKIFRLMRKKPFNVSFFMEKGMVCEKQKLAGITENMSLAVAEMHDPIIEWHLGGMAGPESNDSPFKIQKA